MDIKQNDNQSKKYRIAVVICSFNRKLLLKQCIQSLLRQTKEVDKIFIVDNHSTNGTIYFLEKNYSNNSKIEIIKLKENLGSAGAFYTGIKKALQEKFDWIWLMDDDALAQPDALEKLSNWFSFKKNNVLGLASAIINHSMPMLNRGILDLDNFWPLPFKPIKPELYKNNKYIEINFAASIGLLLSSDLIKSAGIINKKLFVYGDDVEWCIRLSRYGRIFLIPDSIVIHNNLGSNLNFRKLLFKKYQIVPIENFHRYYYAYRNLIYIGRLYSTNRFKFFVGLIIQLIKMFIGIFLFDNNKIKRIKILFTAIRDGFKINLQDFQKFSN